MDYKEMIDFIIEQFIENNYGEFFYNNKVFESMKVLITPNGLDLRMNYRPISTNWDRERPLMYPFEEDLHYPSDALDAARNIHVPSEFWKVFIETVFRCVGYIWFDRFKDWTTRSVTKTDFTVHVRFKVPDPMNRRTYHEWARSLHLHQCLKSIDGGRYAIPISVIGAAVLQSPYSLIGTTRRDD